MTGVFNRNRIRDRGGYGNNFRKDGFNIGFFDRMLPLVVSMDRENEIGAELFDYKTAIIIFLEYGGSFGKSRLVKFLVNS